MYEAKDEIDSVLLIGLLLLSSEVKLVVCSVNMSLSPLNFSLADWLDVKIREHRMLRRGCWRDGFCAQAPELAWQAPAGCPGVPAPGPAV